MRERDRDFLPHSQFLILPEPPEAPCQQGQKLKLHYQYEASSDSILPMGLLEVGKLQNEQGKALPSQHMGPVLFRHRHGC